MGHILIYAPFITTMNQTDELEIAIVIECHLLNLFYSILQQGFLVKSVVGCSIMDFLYSCGIQKEYVINTIQTVFLDGKPVDDLENTIITKDSVLSLSGAMPGLVGAVMRKKSPFQSFRTSISHIQHNAKVENQIGLVTIKLFNTILSDTAAIFLQKGILIHCKQLYKLIESNLNELNSTLVQWKNKKYNVQRFMNEISHTCIELLMVKCKLL